MDDADRGRDVARWRRTKDVLAAALERPPRERAAFLDQACGGDVALRREVEALLTAHAAAGTFVEVSPLEHLDSSDDWVLAPGDQLGPYRIAARVGSGGMGQVYRATDTRLQRDVAIKILPPELAADMQLRQRVEREARVIAALRHPHICVLHDLGHEGDLDFLVMELVDGSRWRRG